MRISDWSSDVCSSDLKALGNRRVIDIAFKEQRGGKLVFNSFGAKKARGMMARFICEHRLQKAEALKGFDTDGHAFSADGSDANPCLLVSTVESAARSRRKLLCPALVVRRYKHS